MDRLAWLLAPDMGREKLALLVLCAWLLDVLIVNLAWRWRRGQVPRSVTVRAPGSVLTLVYRAGIPLGVLWRGVNTRQVGIPTTWVVGQDNVWSWLGIEAAQAPLFLSRVVVIWLMGVAFWAALWTWYARTVDDPVVHTPLSWWQALFNALGLHMLWALYRGIAALWITNSTGVVLVGVILALAGWLLDPFRRNAMFSPGQQQWVTRDWALLLWTAWAANVGCSLCLLILLHWAWLWVGERILGFVGQRVALPGEG